MNSFSRHMISGRAFFAAILLLTTPAFVACGGDDDEEAAKQRGAAAVASCQTLCDQEEEGQCGFGLTDVCKEFCGLLAYMSADCQTKYQALADCKVGKNAACDKTQCKAEDDAYLASGCGSSGETPDDND